MLHLPHPIATHVDLNPDLRPVHNDKKNVCNEENQSLMWSMPSRVARLEPRDMKWSHGKPSIQLRYTSPSASFLNKVKATWQSVVAAYENDLI